MVLFIAGLCIGVVLGVGGTWVWLVRYFQGSE